MTMRGQELTVSVIVPVYNGARYLGAAIESVLAQSYRPLEIIVVDDGSVDESACVAQQYPVRYYYQSHNGPGAARNLGVGQAKHEFLAFLDADDLWMPDKLESQMATLAPRSDLDAVFGQVEQFNSSDTAAPSAIFAGAALNGIHVGAMLIRRTAFMRVGMFGTHWHVDFVDWFLRAQEAKLEFTSLPDVVMRRRVHTNNLTIRSREIVRAEYLLAIKSALDRRKLLVRDESTPTGSIL